MSITVLKGTFRIWTTEELKVILPYCFLALSLKESVVAIFLVSVDFLGQLFLLVREGGDLLGKGLERRHVGEMKAYLGLHSIGCEISSHRHLGISIDKCKNPNMLLVEETHEVRRTTFRRKGKKKKTRLIKTYISGSKISMFFIL